MKHVINWFVKGVCIFWVSVGIVLIAFPIAAILWSDKPIAAMINIIDEIIQS